MASLGETVCQTLFRTRQINGDPAAPSSPTTTNLAVVAIARNPRGGSLM